MSAVVFALVFAPVFALVFALVFAAGGREFCADGGG